MSMSLGVVLVFDVEVGAEGGHRELGDVACREHVPASADPSELVDDDAVPDRQTGIGGQFNVRLDPDTGDDGIRLTCPSVRP
jgi:hypothetical protein